MNFYSNHLGKKIEEQYKKNLISRGYYDTLIGIIQLKTKILITGVAGFIGSALAKKFVNKGYSVLGIDNLSTGNLNKLPKEVDFIKFDLSKIGLKKKLIKI